MGIKEERARWWRDSTRGAYLKPNVARAPGVRFTVVCYSPIRSAHLSVMSVPSKKCPGCGKDSLTARGLTSHLTQSIDPRCIATRDSLYTDSTNNSNPSQAQTSTPISLPSVDLDAAPEPFEGDFFGTPPRNEMRR
ncbi:hypothetical protein VTO73DRAFT_2201 [Trametes versicolor]